MKKLEFFLLAVVLIGAFAVRLYRFDNPIADWHSWRQADTSAVSRSFIQKGFDVLHPRYNDISRVQSGRSNPEGYRLVEFPLYNLFQAGGFLLFGTFTIEQWGRLVSIFASLAGITFLYLIVRRRADATVAFFTAFFYAFLPYSVYYGRTILPDQAMISAILGGIYFFDLWIEKSAKLESKISKYFFFTLSILFTASALLLKPFAIFFMLPMLYLVWKRFGLSFFRQWKLWLFLVVSITPIILWRIWILQYPEGIPQSGWLIGGIIRLKGAFYYWIFAERIGKLILGYWGLAILVIGMLVNSNRQHLQKYGWLFYSFLASSLLYIFILAQGNLQHDYYQILILPSLAIFLGLGSRVLLYPPKEYIHPLAGRLLLIFCSVFALLFGWYYIRDYFNVNHKEVVEAGKVADRLLPKDVKVIAPYNGDTTLLYYVNRQGWPVFNKSIEEFLAQGANYLVIANPTQDDFTGFGTQFEQVASSSGYLILKLQ